VSRSMIEFSPAGRVAAVLVVLAAAAVAALLLGPTAARGQATPFHAVLSGASEVPPVTTSATGTFEMTVDGATSTFTLNVPSIQNATMAHIHLGAAGTNGPIVVWLFPATATPASPPVSTISASGTAGVNQLVGPLAGDLAGFANALIAGDLYVNVHTTDNPAGHIRGQIMPGVLPAQVAPPPPAAADTGNAGLAATAGNSALLVTAFALLAGLLVAGARLASRLR
jgi:hypothetical protein